MNQSPTPNLQPRMVSVYELLTKLLPLMQGLPDAEDNLLDLWNMGAPDPSPLSQQCQPGLCRVRRSGGPQCTPKWGCVMVKRVLLPAQFTTWWADIAKRQGLSLRAEDVLDGKHLKAQPGRSRRKAMR